MARIFTWPTKSILDLADLIPIGDDATGLDKAASFANLINSLQLQDWLINKATTDAVLKWYKGNNGVDQKDVRLEQTATGLQLNLYTDAGAFISTVWEYRYAQNDFQLSKLFTIDPSIRGSIRAAQAGTAYIVAQADTQNSSSSTSYVTAARSHPIDFTGTVTMYTQIYAQSAQDIAMAFYKNGSILSTQTHSSNSWATKTYNMAVSPGDILEIGFRTVQAGTVYIRYKRLYINNPINDSLAYAVWNPMETI